MSRTNQAQHIVVLDNVSQEDLSRALRRSGLVVSPGCFHNVLVISKAPLRFPDEPNVIDLTVEQDVKHRRTAGVDFFNGDPDAAA